MGVLVLGLLLFVPMPGFCDGNAPEWQPAPGGCTAVTPLWEFLVPWHWGAPDRCIGLCQELAPP